jgi:membrane protein DedA with SNARE-associated domain
MGRQLIDVGTIITALTANPWLAAAAIILATFISEDAATITAGSLAVGGLIPVPVALASLYFGIVAGDAGLYGLGRIAQANGWAQRWIKVRTLVQGRRWLRRRLITALVGARFTPGMRFPTFVASGFLKISFWRFFGVVVCCAAVWTTLIFALIWKFGPIVARALGERAWFVAVPVLVMVLVMPAVFRWTALRRKAAKGAAS